MPTKRLPLVEINWVDAQADNPGWVDDDPDAPVLVLKTFGLLIRKDKHWVVHASTYDPDDHKYSEKAKIPVEWVRNIRVIEEVLIESTEDSTEQVQGTKETVE